MAAIRYAGAVVVLLLSAFIYTRLNLLATFYYNAPSRLQAVSRPGAIEVSFKNDLRNCEDALLNDEEGWMLLSCDPGRDNWNTVMGTFVNHTAPPETGLYLWKYPEGTNAKPKQLQLRPFEQGAHDFHPLGIDYHAPSQTIFVANHAYSGSKVELYRLDKEEGAATLIASIEDSKIAAPNSILAISDTEFYVTNDHLFRKRYNPILATLETYTAYPGGSVVHVKLLENGGTQITTLVNMAMPNGAVLLNDSTLAVASSSSAAVYLYNITPGSTSPELILASRIEVPFIPDNLSADAKGKLLIAGHPHAPSLEKMAKTNRLCQHAEAKSEERCKLDRLSWIADWSEEDGLSSIYVGKDFGTSSTAVRDAARSMGFAVGLYERGIMSWVE